MSALQKLATNLWFDKEAEEAAEFYTSIFKDSGIGRKAFYGEEGREIHGREPGSVMTVEFFLNGSKFIGLNGGPIFRFNEAVSLIVECGDQEELDYYWNRLGEGGDPKAQQCGWLKDKYGLSWQIVPQVLAEMAASKDREKSGRMMGVLMGMKKLDIAVLEKAFAGS